MIVNEVTVEADDSPGEAFDLPYIRSIRPRRSIVGTIS
jgi:hypothetical protein